MLVFCFHVNKKTCLDRLLANHQAWQTKYGSNVLTAYADRLYEAFFQKCVEQQHFPGESVVQHSTNFGYTESP
jgi:hypothetical protein